MNQSAIAFLYAGGPGSGCVGENCGRPKSNLQKTLENLRDSKIWNERNVWVKLATYGHPGTVAPFTKDELKTLRDLKLPSSCKIGFCFQNAQQIAAWNDDSKLKYVEGLATVHGIPFDHAWVEYDGKVYDPTLATYKPDENPDYTKRGTFPRQKDDEPDYVGVFVPKEEIPKYQLRTEMYGPLSHEFKNESLQKKIWRKQE